MVYDAEQVNCTHAAGVDEQTFREWSWHFIDAISYLEADVVGLFACFLSLSALANLTSKFMSQQIIWENRKHGDEGNDCMTSVDGADFRFQAHGKTFYSFKIKKGGLRYLVALCIKTGHIAYIDGPFPAGMMNDLTIFCWGMKGWLGEGERVEADDGYVGEAPQYIKCPKSFTNDNTKRALQSRVRSRHETVNKRMKQFNCLKNQFRHHDIAKHSSCFRAVAVLTQLAIEFGEPLFEVEYSDGGVIVNSNF